MIEKAALIFFGLVAAATLLQLFNPFGIFDSLSELMRLAAGIGENGVH